MRFRFLQLLAMLGLPGFAVLAAGQCGPSGCHVRPQQQPPSTVALPATLESALARIVHQEGQATSLGSGTLVANVGDRSYFLTCAHLFDRAGRTSVQHRGGAAVARIVSIDSQHDLALLETPRVDGTPVRVAEGSLAGQLTACGYGGNGRLRCIRGPVVGRATAVGASAPSLRIRGAVRSGDSGGPVFNAAGRLVAVIWGERSGETFAMGGTPLRKILGTIPPGERPVPPVSRTPDRVEANRWREQIEQRLSDLDRRRPVTPSLPADLVRQGDLQALLNRWEQRFDHLSTQVQIRVGTPAEPPRDPFLLPATNALLTALGVGGPVGIGLFAARVWLRRRNRRRRSAGQTLPAAPSDDSEPQTIAIDTPPPPQRVVPETHYVPYQRDDFARAHQWASEQLVRKFPGSVEMLASLDSLIKQQLNGKEAS